MGVWKISSQFQRPDFAEVPNSGDMKPEETTSSRLAGHPIEGWGHQPTYETLHAKLLLSKGNAGTKME